MVDKPQHTGADELVDALVENGLDTLFGLPGGQLDHLFDAIYRHPGKPRLIRARHEQGAAWMAFGAARSTGKPSVCVTVPGPGIMNAMGALSTAWATNAPVLSLCGQIPSSAIGSGRGYLHEIPDQLATLRTLVKYAERIESANDARPLVNDALTAMQSGRPGPVHLEMAPDVMAATTTQRDAQSDRVNSNQRVSAPVAASEPIDAAAALLANSKRPLIYVGGGAIHACEEVNKLANLLQAPVTCFRSGRGIVDDRHYLSQVFPAGRRLWRDADVVLAVGTRLKYPQLYWGTDDNLNIIRLDIDEREFSRYDEPAVALLGDAQATLEVLIDTLASHADFSPRASRRDELQTLKHTLNQEITERVGPQMAYLKAIREVLPEDGIFCEEITLH